MRTRQEIIDELELLYRSRLRLRVDRMTKRVCRNCVNKTESVTEDGVGRKCVNYGCKLGLPFHHDGKCGKFKCLYNEADIEGGMLEDIRNPAVRGAKEPKIAALVWVLQGGDEPAGLGSWLMKFFTRGK